MDFTIYLAQLTIISMLQNVELFGYFDLQGKSISQTNWNTNKVFFYSM